jgi:molybdate transport system permease protein
MRRAVPAVGVFVATFVALGFLALPIVAIFARVPPGRLIAQLGNPVVTDALVVSLKTTLVAQALVLVFGTPAAYVLASRRFRGRALLVTLVELPLVLPPAVAGIGLLAAFGRTGLLHTSIPFTQAAVVLAVSFVASPLYVRAGIAAFEGVDANVVAASRTLGAGPVRTFFRVVLPLARAGLVAGTALAFARGLGEFGATIMFAGSLRGVTQTLPLAVYSQFDVDFEVALAVSALLVLISAALLVTLKWLPSASTSRFRFAISS